MIRRKKDGCPACALAKARRLIASFQNGRAQVQRLKSNGYLRMNIGPHWRLLSKNNGESWMLLVHAEYDKEIQK